VSGVYVDTSALGRVLLDEADAPAILSALGAFEQRIASRMLRVELRRVALRTGRLDRADQLLATVALVPVDEDLLGAAETIPPPAVATIYAVHLVTALRVAHAGLLDTMITYDAALAAAAREHRLRVLAPA
jgi:hypothetical protein